MKRTLIIAGIALTVLTVGMATQGVTAQSRTFTVQLSGAGEVPPVDTKARGNAVFRLNNDGTEMTYRLIVANIENVRASHIHMAPAGTNGPIVVTLYGGPTLPGRVNGVLAEGIITAADLSGTLAGEPLSALVDRFESGDLYVNVHTDQVPSGEIRGHTR